MSKRLFSVLKSFNPYLQYKDVCVIVFIDKSLPIFSVCFLSQCSIVMSWGLSCCLSPSPLGQPPAEHTTSARAHVLLLAPVSRIPVLKVITFLVLKVCQI